MIAMRNPPSRGLHDMRSIENAVRTQAALRKTRARSESTALRARGHGRLLLFPAAAPNWLWASALSIALGCGVLHAQSRSASVVRSEQDDGCGKAKLPLTFRASLVLVRISINQKPMTFIVDSAGTTMINSDRVSLPVVGQIRTSAVTVSAAEPLDLWNVVRVKSLTVGALDLRDSQVLSRSLRSLETKVGQEVDGILGNDVLRLWDSASFDYKHRVLVLERSVCPEQNDQESLDRLTPGSSPARR